MHIGSVFEKKSHHLSESTPRGNGEARFAISISHVDYGSRVDHLLSKYFEIKIHIHPSVRLRLPALEHSYQRAISSFVDRCDELRVRIVFKPVFKEM
jgi:hypothetical protein